MTDLFGIEPPKPTRQERIAVAVVMLIVAVAIGGVLLILVEVLH